jgi:hypothetical protein
MEKTQYAILREKLIKLKLDYKIKPSQILNDRINMLHTQLKEVDKSIGRCCCTGGNYKSALGYEIECAKYNLLDEIGVEFGFYKVINWLSNFLNKK